MKSALKLNIKSETKPKKEDVGMGDSPAEEMAESKEYEDYELTNAVDTLHKAEEIKQDASLMKAIAPMLDKKEKAVKSVADLRKIAKDKFGSDRMEA